MVETWKPGGRVMVKALVPRLVAEMVRFLGADATPWVVVIPVKSSPVRSIAGSAFRATKSTSPLVLITIVPR